MPCGLARSVAVGMLLVFGASAAPAQSSSVVLLASNHSGSGPEFRAVSTAEGAEAFPAPYASAFDAPLPTPPQLSCRKAIVLGIVIGGAVGATAGYLIGKDSCTRCDYSYPVLVASSLGAVVGAALGGFVAAQNSRPDVAHSSLRRGSTPWREMPHPVVRYQVLVFR